MDAREIKEIRRTNFSNARSEKQNSPYGTYIHLKQHFLNSSVVDLIRRHSTLSKIIKRELCLVRRIRLQQNFFFERFFEVHY